MRQGEGDSNDSFLQRFWSEGQLVELVGGKNVFCSEKLINAADKKNITDDEREAEREQEALEEIELEKNKKEKRNRLE